VAPRRCRESTIQSPPGDQRTKPERDTSEYTKHELLVRYHRGKSLKGDSRLYVVDVTPQVHTAR
jgi:hypothetical protein